MVEPSTHSAEMTGSCDSWPCLLPLTPFPPHLPGSSMKMQMPLPGSWIPLEPPPLSLYPHKAWTQRRSTQAFLQSGRISHLYCSPLLGPLIEGRWDQDGSKHCFAPNLLSALKPKLCFPPGPISLPLLDIRKPGLFVNLRLQCWLRVWEVTLNIPLWFCRAPQEGGGLGRYLQSFPDSLNHRPCLLCSVVEWGSGSLQRAPGFLPQPSFFHCFSSWPPSALPGSSQRPFPTLLNLLLQPHPFLILPSSYSLFFFFFSAAALLVTCLPPGNMDRKFWE